MARKGKNLKPRFEASRDRNHKGAVGLLREFCALLNKTDQNVEMTVSDGFVELRFTEGEYYADMLQSMNPSSSVHILKKDAPDSAVRLVDNAPEGIFDRSVIVKINAFDIRQLDLMLGAQTIYANSSLDLS